MRTVHALRAVFGIAALTLAVLFLPGAASSQDQKEQKERVRVPTSHANVHMGPSSGQQVLVLAPKGTVLTVLGRRGEWIQVQLTPELRKTGMVMRWYKNETSGWMHDSTVVAVDAKSP